MVADRQGFEPWRRSPAYTLSRRAPSTTRPPVHQRGLARPLGDLQEACATIKKRQNPSLQNLIRCLKEKKLCVLRPACKSFMPQTMPRNTEAEHQSMRKLLENEHIAHQNRYTALLRSISGLFFKTARPL